MSKFKDIMLDWADNAHINMTDDYCNEDSFNKAKQDLYQLISDGVIGQAEYRETDDMSLKSWTPKDYKAFGRNELRAEMTAALKRILE